MVDTLTRAARVAAGRGAADSAVAYLRRALDEPPSVDRRADVLVELGVAEAFVDGYASVEHLLAGYEELTDPGARAEIAVALVSPLMFTGRAAEAHALALDAVAPLGPEHDALRRWIDANRLAIPHFDLTAGSIRDPEYELYRGELHGPDLGARALAAAAAYQWAMTGGSADECVALAQRSLEDGTLIEGTHAGGPTMGAVIVLALADHPDAVRYCDEVLVSAHRYGSLFEASGGYLFRGFSYLLRGSLAEAEPDLVRALELTERWGSTAVLLYPALLPRADAGGARRPRGGAPGHRARERASRSTADDQRRVVVRVSPLDASRGGRAAAGARCGRRVRAPVRGRDRQSRLGAVAVAARGGASQAGPKRRGNRAGARRARPGTAVGSAAIARSRAARAWHGSGARKGSSTSRRRSRHSSGSIARLEQA